MFDTLREACQKWVSQFNEVPNSALEKINNLDGSVHEITPITKGNRVYCIDAGEQGDVLDYKQEKDENVYLVKLDGEDEPKYIMSSKLEAIYDYTFPIWNTMWTFGEKIDEEWLTGEYCEPHLQEMADCGFRIYESEDYGIVFGIDGAGYDFYAHHWIPLYKARGLRWHKEAE